MSSLAVVGAQWGDEGKGKLVDYLTSQADFVVRFQGGNNAGHTLVVDGVTTKLSLVPSGILHEATCCLLGAGVVVNPEVFIQEVNGLKKAGVRVDPSRLVIDRDAHLILDYHIEIDKAREEMRGKDKIGTTGRGIGPCYEDRAQRVGVRFAELRLLSELKPRLQKLVEHKNRYLVDLLGAESPVDFDSLWSKLENISEILSPYIGDVSHLLNRARLQEKKIVFEGAQGTLLDQTFGTVPFVTSSNTISGAITTGCGVGPKTVDYVLGVAKAYCTRVGSGPFPTELEGETSDYLREKGSEFGTVTNRPRRCGWFDAVAMKRAVGLNGLDSLVITKLDVLSGLEDLKVCIKYKIDGKEIEEYPSLSSELEKVEPEYITLDGWSEDITSVRKWHELPPAARLYISTLSEILGIPVSIVSVGAERESTLFSRSAKFVKNFMMSV
ncbi:MAG: adenylosuccinate synthase [Deltaproteobacteria bacterium]|nr:adenylosuccinate synthase [Deltaproteobacteria bacterium]